MRHLLGLRNVPAEEIISILDTAKSFRELLDRPVKKSAVSAWDDGGQPLF